MAKAAYLKLVACKIYNNPTIIGSPITKGQVVRLTNPQWIAHLKGLKTVISEDNEKLWFKDVTREDEYLAYEEKVSAAQAAATAIEPLSDDEGEEAPATSAKATASQRAPRTTKPVTKSKAKADAPKDGE